MQKLEPKINAHTHIIHNLTCRVTCEEQNHTSIDMLEIEMTCTRHVVLR